MNEGTESVRIHSGVGRGAACRRRGYLWAAALLLLALLAGIAIGVSATVLYFEKHVPRKGPHRTPEQIAEGLLTRMEKTVSISAAERAELLKVVAGTMHNVNDIRDGFSDQMRDVFSAMNVHVERILGKDRYAKWDEEKNRQFAEQARRDHRHWYNRRREREAMEKTPDSGQMKPAGGETSPAAGLPDAD